MKAIGIASKQNGRRDDDDGKLDREGTRRDRVCTKGKDEEQTAQQKHEQAACLHPEDLVWSLSLWEPEQEADHDADPSCKPQAEAPLRTAGLQHAEKHNQDREQHEIKKASSHGTLPLSCSGSRPNLCIVFGQSCGVMKRMPLK
jgi:hypothetical protein